MRISSGHSFRRSKWTSNCFLRPVKAFMQYHKELPGTKATLGHQQKMVYHEPSGCKSPSAFPALHEYSL